MAKKTTAPIITHTEILARAINSVIREIEEWRTRCEALPQPQKDSAFDFSTKELREKLATMKALYRIETGADFD